MRQQVNRTRLEQFLRAFGRVSDRPTRVYLTGGASAVILGWRDSTIDIDLKIDPANEPLLRAIPDLKEELHVNVELASPMDFIPEVPGWEGRCKFITQEGAVAFFHYDFYAQALSKIERLHERDILDVREMLQRKLVEPRLLRELFEAVIPFMFRFPSLDPKAFRRNLDSFVPKSSAKGDPL